MKNRKGRLKGVVGVIVSFMSGARVLQDRYRIVQRLGRGGMGTVWRAHDQVLGRDVAVKEILLPPGLDEAELASMRGRALREARAAAKVRHPAVVTIHDVIIQDDHPWIVMDFVRAPSLADRLAELGALSVTESARVGAMLAGALGAVHRHGIVHRDLKPANVLLADDGEVVLTDFGIAVIEGDARFTRSGLLIGTPGFMAPECLAGELAGPASDLWSLGAVLFTTVEGTPPYEGSSAAVIAATVLNGAPAPQQRSGPLAPLITALLARDPGARPDAQKAAACLEEIALSSEGRKDSAVADEPDQLRLHTTIAAAIRPDETGEADQVYDQSARKSLASSRGSIQSEPRGNPMEPWCFWPPNDRVKTAATAFVVFSPVVLIAVLLIMGLLAEIFGGGM